MNSRIKGFVAEGYEPVKKCLEDMMRTECEDKLQLCVYVGGKCVIDLYGSQNEDVPYDGNSLQVNWKKKKKIKK